MPSAPEPQNRGLLRLFFALPCPPEQAAAICQWRAGQALPGRPVPEANLHLTLAFLGTQPASLLPELYRLAQTLHCPTFELRLEHLDSLGHGFICLRPSRTPVALDQLASLLREALFEHGLVLPDSRAFVPHLTLTRQAPQRLHGQAPLFTWPVERFGLYQSYNDAEGVHYRELASWPLLPPERASI